MTASECSPRLTAVFSAPFLGGSELFNVEYLKLVRAAGIDIHAIIPEEGPLGDALASITQSVSSVPVPNAIQQISRFDTRFRTLRFAGIMAETAVYLLRLRRALTATRGPIVCFGLRAQLAVGLLKPTLSRPILWVLHEVVPDGAFAGAWGRAAHRADAIFAYSRAAAEQPHLKGVPARVLAVRLDLSRFSEVAKPIAPPQTLGLIGDLFPLKNHLALIRVVHHLQELGLPVQGLLLGRVQANEKDDVDEYTQAVQAALEERPSAVHLKAVAPEAMPAAMQEIDVLLHLSSIPETFGRVCAEAMAAGRPVIAYAHGAVAEVVPDGVAGIHCPPHDEEAVTAAFCRLYQSKALFETMSDAARRHAVESYGEGQQNETIGDALVRFSLAATVR